ncbi:MAG: flagellar M-ring protein FliF [Nocardioidaceae bacterium]|nr:flagellar M-ring protein FliF [Nocardioidaceae bacterium]
MKDNVTRSLARLQRTFAAFTPGQKVVAIIGTGALLLAGFLVFRWVAAPSYAPLFSNLASSDASAIIQQLDSQGVPYKLSNGGNTIMVPQDQVYSTRIQLSGEGLPSASDSGYSILDNQSLSTSQFQEQTSFKRAMEGELANTIEAIDGVDAAVVHLAMPQKQVFSDQQDPTTASVLVKTSPGTTLTPEQVQAIVNLTASSIDGLKADNVTVADSTGKVLSVPGVSGGVAGTASSQNQQVVDFQNRLDSQVQTMLDRVLGPGNSAVQVTANLSFDKTVSDTTRYFGNADMALSATESKEILKNGTPGSTQGGVLGPDGQMNPTTGTTTPGSSYEKTDKTSDNAIDKTVEHREAAPGGVNSLHIGVVLDTQALKGINPAVVQTLIGSALGINPSRGDTIDVTSMPFDRTAQTAAAAELAASQKAEKQAQTMSMARNGGLILLVMLVVLVAWIQARRRAKARAEATDYVVEQLRRDAVDRAATQAALEPPAAMLALEAAESDQATEMRDEIAALVERQPEDVAALLRGWLVERGA